ncbi:hypothetical protein [Novispirillum itersonii]|uniref:hypothetical protein n=1 Tax=Novispirillum itersonii TaxID=189 RepID=UPI000371EF31|nr:hypothetical protein [Novispirillum itersonii]
MSTLFLRSAVVYALFGIMLGIQMAATQQFDARPVHAHALLAGWLSMAVMGVMYKVFPALKHRVLGPAHFWLHSIGLPVMLAGVFAIHRGQADIGEPIAGIGSMVFAVGIIAFAVNVWRHVKED